MLYIPFHKFKYLGGPSSFMMNLKNYLDDVGYKYSNSFWNAKGIFFPMGYRPQKLWIAKRLGMKIIQRLDGVYYPSQHGSNYRKYNKLQENNYLKYSDFVIFQSEYSKKQVFKMFGEIEEEKYTIIYNGADKNVFYPYLGEKLYKNKLSFITVGVFRKSVMLEPIILALDSLYGNYKFELHIVGPINYEPLREYLNRKYVVFHNKLDKNELSKIYRQSNALIHTQINDNCPNTVIEAISCGLPVVGFDSGAMSELCSFSTELLAEVNNEIFQKVEDFDYYKLRDKIKYLIDNYDFFYKRAIENSFRYDFKETGKKYIEFFNKILN